MRAEWFTADLGAIPRGVIVADAGAAARGLWDGPVLSILEECRAALPAAAPPDVVFLGGRRAHPLPDVLRGLGANDPSGPGPAPAMGDEFGRGPVVGPFFRTLADGPPRPVVLIATRPVLDLDDWAEPTFTRTVLVYRLVGADRVTPPVWVECGAADTDLERVVAHLADPLVSIEVGGGVAALEWDAPGLTWGAGRLSGPAPGGLLTARFLGPEGVTPSVRGTRTSGIRLDLPVRPAPPPAAVDVIVLTPAEEAVLRVWERGSPFWCGGCQGSHPPGKVRCDPEGGGAVLPTLAGWPAGAVGEVERGPGGWAARRSASGVVALADGRLYAGGAVFEFTGDDWQPTGEPVPLFPATSSGCYLVRT